MTYLLDTNTCITFLRGRNLSVADKLYSIKREDIALCSIVKAELYFGAHRSQNPEKSLSLLCGFFSSFKSLSMDDEVASQYGKIRSELTQRRITIGPHDLLIASIAIANNLTLVTHNTREFSRIQNLEIEDWEK